MSRDVMGRCCCVKCRIHGKLFNVLITGLEKRAIFYLSRVCQLVIIFALTLLGLRSAFYFDSWYDSFLYHLPFAAHWGGLPIPFEFSDEFRPWFEGFPQLAEFVQGVFWRITGSVNATGVVGYLAFLIFLIYCHRVLRASFWIVGMIALTAPLVIIHAASSYIDLFGNSFLAMGLCSCLYLYIFPEQSSRKVFFGGLIGFVAAAWTKFLMVPPVGFCFILLTVIVLRRERIAGLYRRKALAFLTLAIGLAAAPYIQNWILYSNPFWPGRVPFIGEYFPYMLDSDALGALNNRPDHLLTESRLTLFIHSIFEINHPTSYPDRTRWTLDQGVAWVAFRMGGFWVWGVVTYFLTSCAMLIAFKRKIGIYVCLSFIGIIGLITQIPQSHELRYFLFIPLCWAAIIGMLYPTLVSRAPRVALGFLALSLGLFLYMVSENRSYYKVDVRTYKDATVFFGTTDWWPKMKKGERYCAVGMVPAAMALTGPTMSEFQVVERSHESLCPKDTLIMTYEGISEQRGTAGPAIHTVAEFIGRSAALIQNKDFYGSIVFSKRALELDPNVAPAYNNMCIAYGELKKWNKAIDACRRAVELNPDFQLAKNNLDWVVKMLAEQAQNAD